MVIKRTKLFDQHTQDQERVMGVGNRASSLILNVYGTSTEFSIIIRGVVNIDDDEWQTISIIDMGSMTTKQSIDEGGMYTIPLDGLCAISAELQISDGDITASASICD